MKGTVIRRGPRWAVVIDLGRDWEWNVCSAGRGAP
jgi:hypothetical protein